jgi:hypothetical protein
MFRSTYRTRRTLLPIDGFFEWKAIGEEPDPRDLMKPFGRVDDDVADIHGGEQVGEQRRRFAQRPTGALR